MLPHERFLRLALEEAHKALEIGEVPVGAVVVREGQVVGRGFNQPIGSLDPTGHAEIVALRDAARHLGNYRIPESSLYVTLEPCVMCVGALANARVGTLIYGAAEPKFGAIASVLRAEELRLTHRFEVVSGVLEAECRALIQDFFRFRRAGR